ncbi:MAG: adenylate/guanylate cyclase domain-containing protein [Spirochaetia bacterium]|nr:adenylate/guanylate cyclase domain-containing protein [Spirochaetia bacterium]
MEIAQNLKDLHLQFQGCSVEMELRLEAVIIVVIMPNLSRMIERKYHGNSGKKSRYCFSRFELISEKLNIEKIKTIDYAYMCAPGAV